MKIKKVKKYTYTDEEIAGLEAACLIGMKENGHALISPSGIYKWGECLGSLSGLHHHRSVASDNVMSVEGVTGHYISEIALINRIRPSAHSPSTINHSAELIEDIRRWSNRIINHKHNTDAVKDAAKGFVKQLLTIRYDRHFMNHLDKVYDAVMEKVNAGYELHAELQVKMGSVLGHSQCDGISDIILFNPITGHLIVSDLKYGVNVEVYPEFNPQLALYGVGAKCFMEQKHGAGCVKSMSIVINQPRVKNRYWDEWVVKLEWLNDFTRYVKERASLALFAIAYPDKIGAEYYVASKESCQYCHRKVNCAVRLDALKTNINKLFNSDGATSNSKPTTQDILNISNDDLAEILNVAPFVTSCIKDFEAEARRRVIAGGDIGGRKLVEGKNKREWFDKPEKMISVFKMIGLTDDEIYTKKLKSVPQMETISIPTSKRKMIDTMIKYSKSPAVVALSNDRRLSIEETRKNAAISKFNQNANDE